MITVNEAYNKALEEADKNGSDYFSLPQFLVFFKNATYDFLGSRVKDVEASQTITDDIRPLVITNGLNLVYDINDPEVFNEMFTAIPSNYYRGIRLNVKYNDGSVAREPNFIRHGEEDHVYSNPNKRPTKDYPLIKELSNVFRVVTNLPVNGTLQASKLICVYVKHPTFGSSGPDKIVDLPIDVVYLLTQRTANSFMETKGDARVGTSIQYRELFRKKDGNV